MTVFEKILAYAGGKDKLAHNYIVFESLLHALGNGNVVPFVGAGMSAPIYPLWGKTLSLIADQLLGTSAYEEFQKIFCAEDVEAYTKAADFLEDKLGKHTVHDILRVIFSEKELNRIEYGELAVHLLPLLFPKSMVITTNFDRILEHVYQDSKKQFECVFGVDSDATTMIAQGNHHCLMKLHGDIAEHISPQNIIFSKSDYDRIYDKDSEMVQVLTKLYKGKMMLFLGCSLKQDRTLKILEKIVADETVEHYAIIPSSKEDLLNNIRFFGEKRINTIFYDPDNPNHHGAVQVIMEELIRRIDPAAFHDYIHSKPIKPSYYDKPFYYTTMASGFFGREKEMEELRHFAYEDFKDGANEQCDIRWLTIIGSGGQGKSRLSLELENELIKKRWQVIRLVESQYNSLHEVTIQLERNAQNLIIADNGRSHAKELGVWMDTLEQQLRSAVKKVRILILDRKEDMNLANDIAHYGGSNMRWEKDTIQLNPITDEETIKKIMKTYAKYKGKEITPKHLNMLYDTLKRIDEDEMRPLYAILVTDALCNGKNPENWDRENVLSTVLNDEEKNIERKMKGNINDTKETLENCINPLRLISTFSGGLSLESIRKQYKEQWEEFSSEFPLCKNKLDRLEKRLQEMGLVVNGVFEALQPDLLGEFFVLQHMKEAAPLLFSSGWEDDVGKLAFLIQLFIDYPQEIDTEYIYCVYFQNANPQTSSGAAWFTHLLGNVMNHINGFFTQSVFYKLEEIAEKYKSTPEVAVNYARGLFNYIALGMDVEGIPNCVEQLRILADSEQYHGNQDIVMYYVCGLINLSYLSEKEDIESIVEKLRIISEDVLYKDIPEIVLRYAKGLVNLSRHQTLEEMTDTLDKLYMLMKKFRGNSDFVIMYASCVGNLSHRQSGDCKMKTIKKIKNLIEIVPEENRQAIALDYAVELLKCLALQESDEIKDILILLRDLTKRYPDYLAIKWIYAKALELQDDEDEQKEAEKILNSFEELSEIDLEEMEELLSPHYPNLYAIL